MVIITERFHSSLDELNLCKAEIMIPVTCEPIPIPGQEEWLSGLSSPCTKKHPEGQGSLQSQTHCEHDLTLNETSSRNDKIPSRMDSILLGPYNYMAQHPGKDIRRQLITAFDAWLNVPKDKLAIIINVVAMLHTASLLIDDIEDCSVLRRGVPVAHNIFGTAQTINSANYVYFLALDEVRKLNNPTATQIYVQELLDLHRGQGMDLFWRDTLTCPSENEYLEMVGNKTGGLFRLAVRLMQAESKVRRDYTSLANLLGLIFQICDDVLNLSSTAYHKNKGLCEDLTEGKFSFPIIHSIRSDPDNLLLTNILRQKTMDEGVKLYAIEYMKKTGSFVYSRRTVTQLMNETTALIDSFETEGGKRLNGGENGGTMIRAVLERIVDRVLKEE